MCQTADADSPVVSWECDIVAFLREQLLLSGGGLNLMASWLQLESTALVAEVTPGGVDSVSNLSLQSQQSVALS